jgi:hypothetical protein
MPLSCPVDIINVVIWSLCAMVTRLVCTHPFRYLLRRPRIHIVALQTFFTENRTLPVSDLSIYHIIEDDNL